MSSRAYAPLIALAFLPLLLVACAGGGAPAKPTPTPLRTQTSTATPPPAATPTPSVRIPNVSPASDISLPDGFAAYAIAEGFDTPTSIALAPDYGIFISASGSVYRLVDANGDGVFEDRARFASGFGGINGIMVAPDGTVYVSSTGQVATVRDTNGDGAGDTSQAIIAGLPHGRHQNNGLAIGPDGMLYVTNGSTCDDCQEDDPRSATILQANADGSGLRVYAKGLRNPYDLVFDNRGRLWATDNGSDAPCATIDELNLIVDGGDYGWPYDADGCDPLHDATPPAGDLRLHSASTGITSYDANQFPAQYRDTLFITLWGGTFPPRAAPALVRATVRADNSTTIEDFATGFEHPIDVVTDRDGTLLVLDYSSGTLYRILYTG